MNDKMTNYTAKQLFQSLELKFQKMPSNGLMQTIPFGQQFY